MTSHALARTQNVQVETLPAATAMDVLKQHPSDSLQYLVEREAMIAPLLPEGVRFLSVVWELVTALQKDAQQKKPALVHCAPDTVFLAITRIQEWGLKIGHTAHLVPFSNVCTPIIDYKGEIQLATDARVITHAKANCVYEGETFEYEEGTTPIFRHVPSIRASERGAMLGAYALLTLPTREKIPHYMPLADINKIRERFSKQWNSKIVGDCPDWYAKKTPIRQGLNTVPKSSNAERYLRTIERMESERVARAEELTQAIGDAPQFEQLSSGERFDVKTGEIQEPGPENSEKKGPEEASPHGSLAWAQAFPLPLSKSEFYNKPLGTLDPEYLAELPGFCERKMAQAEAAKRDVSPAITDLYTATQILLESNAKATDAATAESIDDDDIPMPKAPSTEPELGLDDQPKGAPAGSLSYKPGPGGKQEDAFKKPLGTDALRAG